MGGKGSKVNVGNGCALRRLTYEMGATEVNWDIITVASLVRSVSVILKRISVELENNAAIIAELDIHENTW